MEEQEVSPVVRDENPSLLCREQELLIVGGARAAQLPGRDHIVTIGPEIVGALPGNVVVEVEGGHRAYALKAAALSANRASMSARCRW